MKSNNHDNHDNDTPKEQIRRINILLFIVMMILSATIGALVYLLINQHP